MLMLCSSMLTSHHNDSQLPVVMLGGAVGGDLRLDFVCPNLFAPLPLAYEPTIFYSIRRGRCCGGRHFHNFSR